MLPHSTLCPPALSSVHFGNLNTAAATMGCWLTLPVLCLGWAVLILSFGMYAVFEWVCGGFYKYQNLRQRYKAEWALVTGASSGGWHPRAAAPLILAPSRSPKHLPPCLHPTGIGKALAKRLADQGLNVVLVALPDDTLETTHEQLVADYPSVQFRKVRGSCQLCESTAGHFCALDVASHCGEGPGLLKGCSQDRESHGAAASRTGRNMDGHTGDNMPGGLMVASTHRCCDSHRLTQQPQHVALYMPAGGDFPLVADGSGLDDQLLWACT